MTIAKKLYALITAVALGLLLLGGAGIYQMTQIYAAANYANTNTVPSLLVLDEAYNDLSHMRIGVWQHLTLSDQAQKTEKQKAIAGFEADVQKSFDRYEREDISDERDRALLANDRAAMTAYNGLLHKVLALSDAGQDKEARELQFSQQAVITKLDSAISEHREHNVQLGKQGAEAAQASLQASIWIAVVTVLAAGAGIVGMGVFLARSIAHSLRGAVSVARSVAAGDLTREIDVSSRDEVGQLMCSLRDMNSNLVDIVTKVREGTDTIATASTQIAAGNLDLSSRTEQQAGSLEETASSMEELTSTVKQNSDNARQANQLASTASDVAQSGGGIVSQVVQKMSAITDSSRKISDIISVIDGIAFQTNILALNAAVEAARAGEQGRGFAVVASEVRNLAQRSASAAKEIKTLIEDSSQHVSAGSKLVEEAGAAMQNIVDSVRRVTTVVGEISTASHEQAAGIEQINQAIMEMDGTTQQNAALVEQAAAAAASLQDQAASLSHIVGVFKLDAQAPRLAYEHKPRLAKLPAAARPVALSPPAKQAPAKRAVAAQQADWVEF